jgi:hypothetical protein
VTLAAKLTDSVSLEDSKTAASATAVKTAYDLASTKQPNLGFTPIQQGGGTEQGINKVYIGWATDGSGLKAQVDNTNIGNIVTTAGGTTKAPSAALADNAWQTTIVPNVAFVGRGGAIPNGGTWLYIYIPYDSHYLSGVTLAGGATAPSNDGGTAIRVA